MLSLVEVLLTVSALRCATPIEAREAHIEAIGVILLHVSSVPFGGISKMEAAHNRVKTLCAIFAVHGLVWARRAQTYEVLVNDEHKVLKPLNGDLRNLNID